MPIKGKIHREDAKNAKIRKGFASKNWHLSILKPLANLKVKNTKCLCFCRRQNTKNFAALGALGGFAVKSLCL